MGAAILGNKLFWKVNHLEGPAPQQKVQESRMMSSVANAHFKDSASDFMNIRYNLCSRLNQWSSEMYERCSTFWDILMKTTSSHILFTHKAILHISAAVNHHNCGILGLEHPCLIIVSLQTYMTKSPQNITAWKTLLPQSQDISSLIFQHHGM
jgi:hypothetical protein